MVKSTLNRQLSSSPQAKNLDFLKFLAEMVDLCRCDGKKGMFLNNNWLLFYLIKMFSGHINDGH